MNNSSPLAPTQLIVIDIDGTLFNSQQTVSTVNIMAIEHALSAGVKIALASGRGSIGIDEVLRLCDLDLPYICSAGSGIFSGKKGIPLRLDLIPYGADLFKALDIAEQYQLGWIMDLPDDFCWQGDQRLLDSMDAFSRSGMREDARITDLKQLAGKQILKISFFAPPAVRVPVKEAFSNLTAFETVYAGLNYIDLTPKGVNKGTALIGLASALNIPLANTAAIGDQEIDLSMFEQAGVSIAMGNAPSEIQNQADIVAPSNDEDGVAWAIERLINNF